MVKIGKIPSVVALIYYVLQTIECTLNLLEARVNPNYLKFSQRDRERERERESPKSSREGGWSGGATVLAARCQAFTVKSMDFFTV